MEEIWRDVTGFEDYYKVSSFGRIFSKRSNKLIKTGIHPNKSIVFSTKIGGRFGDTYCFKVHRLVAEAFLINPNNYPVVNHKDGNRQNNNVHNLEWCTQSQNVQHAYDSGLKIPDRGCNRFGSKLSSYDVEFIRENKSISNRKLAKLFGVSHNTISKVKLNKSY